jgi:hypothetical protein
MINLGRLPGMMLVVVLLLSALSGVTAGQERTNPSTTDVENKIQSLRNQLDSLKKDFGRRLDRIESLTDQQGTTKHDEERSGSSPGLDNEHRAPGRDDRATNSLARSNDRDSDACCRHAYQRQPCCRQVYHPQPCCRRVYHHIPCCRSLGDLERWLSELE